ncbi:MAG: hypothetical protein RLZZ630_2056 [Bacteroidota bacterium]|jgi:Rrf2 family protein
MISTRTRYALHALVYLASGSKDTAIRISEIAEANRLPRKFLENILVELKKGGLLTSRRGQLGGYRLARPSETIRLSEIVRILEGPISISPCSNGGICEECVGSGSCHLRSSFKTVNNQLWSSLDDIRLSGLVRSRSKLKQNPKGSAKSSARKS